jgi:hypothetical protein
VRKAISEQHRLTFKYIGNGYRGAWLDADYGQVNQR